ncbi:MAG: hypothetical protein ABIH50_05590 [bacterium]
MRNKYLLVWLMIFTFFAAAAKGEESMTQGEAIELLSKTSFVKKKVDELFSWAIGYDLSRVNKMKLTPTINFLKAVPRKMPPDGRTIFDIQAGIEDPKGLTNVAGVRADLAPIGRLPGTSLVDNGLFGDQKSNDGVYTLQTNVAATAVIGGKDIPVSVTNKDGWLALAKVSLDVKKNPMILSASCQPEKALADGKALVTITVKVENPGRDEDIAGVFVDLRQINLPERYPLLNNGLEGDMIAGDNIWAARFVLPTDVRSGKFIIPVQAINIIGGLGAGEAALTVYK